MLKSAVIGSGGAGRNMLSLLSGSDIPLYLINSVNDPAYRNIFSNSTEIMASVSTDPQIKRSLMTTEKAALQVMNEHDLVFSLSGLGGFYGTMVPVMLSRLSGNLVPFVAIPFSMEGEGRKKQARYGLEKLLECAPWVLALENDRLLEIAPNATIQGAFRAINMVFADCIIQITENFEDAKEVIGALTGKVGIGIGEGEGMNRAEKALRDAFRSPWLNPEKRAILIMRGGSSDDFFWTISEMEEKGLEITLKRHWAGSGKIELLIIG